MLHIINKNNPQMISDCLGQMGDADALLLIENAVLCSLNKESFLIDKKIFNGLYVYVLTPDLEARGFTQLQCHSDITPIDYAGFVDLVAKKNPIRSWF